MVTNHTHKLTNLVFLDLNRNQIESIEFEHLFESTSKLKELYLSENRLSVITENDFVNFDNLEKIDLDFIKS